MAAELSRRLRMAVETDTPLLAGISEELAAAKPDRKWSRKQELGHLIDSASNNHLRFVRAALEPRFDGPGYDQDRNVELHGYQELPWLDLVEFWRRYNVLLAALIVRIPDTRMQTPCVVGGGAEVSLEFLIDDYIIHMQHHLDHVLKRDAITAYPRN